MSKPKMDKNEHLESKKLVSDCCGAEFYTAYYKDKDPMLRCENCQKPCIPVEESEVRRRNDDKKEK